jgi:hypothetical protein
MVLLRKTHTKCINQVDKIIFCKTKLKKSKFGCRNIRDMIVTLIKNFDHAVEWIWCTSVNNTYLCIAFTCYGNLFFVRLAYNYSDTEVNHHRNASGSSSQKIT